MFQDNKDEYEALLSILTGADGHVIMQSHVTLQVCKLKLSMVT